MKQKQKAVVDFLCDPDRTGTETDLDPEDKYEGGDERLSTGVSSLKFLSFDYGKDVDILRLEWRTKYACESQNDEDDAAKKGHWGFFTWFLIM
jgi:autophagy-related protein 27